MVEASPIVAARFRVADLPVQRRFYEDVLGLEAVRETAEEIGLAPPGSAFEIELAHRPSASDRPRPSIGLFHLAYRLPDRRSLAEAVARLREQEVALEGVADHGVSEAVYLSDAEGNGIELYRDRPREAWRREGEQVVMVTDPLDVRRLLAEAREPAGLPAETRLGHVHLHVPDLETAEVFYGDRLGLRVRQRDFPGALFLARGDYHHHVGVNTWAHGRRAPADAVGLAGYTWRAEPEELDRLREVAERSDGHGLVVEDPAGVELRVEPGG